MINASISPFLTPIIKDLQLTYSQVGVILGAWQLTYILVAFFAGLLIDRVGTKISLSFGMTIISISMVLRGFSTNFETMFMAVTIFGIGGPFISIGLPKLIASYFLGEEKGTAVGIYLTGSKAGSAFSFAIANSVLIPLAGTWQNAMYLYTLSSMSVLIIWLLAGREPASGGERKQSPIQSRPSSTFKSMSILLKNRNVRLIALIGFSGFFVSHGLGNWLQKILESKGMTPSTAGFITSIYTIIVMTGSIIAPKLQYRVGSGKRLVIPILVLGGMGLFLIGASIAPFFWIGLIISGFTQGSLLPLMLIFLMELPEVGAEYMGNAAGIYFTFGEIGGCSAPLLMGYFRDLTGSFNAGLGMLILVLEATLPLAFLLERAQAN